MVKLPSQLMRDLLKLVRHLSARRRWQLFQLAILVSLSAISEVISLGAVFPFLGALSNPTYILEMEKFSIFISLFKIETTNQLILWSSSIFLVTIILASALRLLTLWLRNELTARISTELSQACFEKTICQPYSFYLHYNSSDLITAAKDYLDGAIQVIQSCLTFGSFFVVFVALLCAFFVFDWKTTIILSLLLFLMVGGIVNMVRHSLSRDSIRIVSLARKRVDLLQVSLGGIRDILLDNSQHLFIKTYAEIDRPIRLLQGKRISLTGLMRPLIEAGTVISLVGLILLRLIQNGDVFGILPTLGGLALGANRMLPAVQQCFAAWSGIQGYSDHLNKFLITLDRPIVEAHENERCLSLELTRYLSLEHVWFKYRPEMDYWNLSDLCLKIPAFSTVGFIGPSGCGKTTVSDIILGLLYPQKGELVVDGIPIASEEKRRAWQATVAHVPQSIYLSDATVAENIAFGLPIQAIDWVKLESSAKLARIHEFTQNLPKRYHEVIGERGVRLSGGQRQRIGIARALYKNASVIVFDEATSAVDAQTEQELMDSIYSLKRNLTMVIIAHRLSTLNKCDYIFEFYKGRIREKKWVDIES